MAKVVLLFGGNLGNQVTIFNNALQLIKRKVGIVKQCSSVYKTPAWGFESEHDFFNQVVILSSNAEPEDLLTRLKNIEINLGRNPLKKSVNGVYQDRLIDIDILFYDDLVYASSQLVIPHPRLHLRKFTLVPLNDLLPNYMHPSIQKKIKTLVMECEDTSSPERM